MDRRIFKIRIFQIQFILAFKVYSIKDIFSQFLDAKILYNSHCPTLQCDLQKGRDKTIDDKSMYIPNDETQNYPFSMLKHVNT